MFLPLESILRNTLVAKKDDGTSDGTCEFHSGLTRMSATEKQQPGCTRSSGEASLLFPCTEQSAFIHTHPPALGELSALPLKLRTFTSYYAAVQSVFT